jgi:hypothetical protein
VPDPDDVILIEGRTSSMRLGTVDGTFPLHETAAGEMTCTIVPHVSDLDA